MVYKWFAEFKRGRPTFGDDLREERPCTFIAKNIDAVREMILSDRHVTYSEIEAYLGIAAKQIHTILRDHLHVRKLSSRWIPQNLKDEQKQARVKWCKEILKKSGPLAAADWYLNNTIQIQS